MGLGERWHEIARTYADVNRAFGDIVKVTPSSKVVGDMAIFLVTPRHDHGASSKPTAEHHNLTLPQFRGRDVPGRAGRARRRLAEEAAEDHSARRESRSAAVPARTSKPVDFDGDRRASCEKKIGRAPSPDEVLSYLMYPEVFLKFAKRARRPTATSKCCRRRSSSTA